MIRCRACGKLQRLALCKACRRRRYGAGHQAARRAWALRLEAGEPVACCRCDGPIDPADPWDLDHRPGGSHPAHATCNRSAGARSIE